LKTRTILDDLREFVRNKHKKKDNVDSIENLTEKENEFNLEVAGSESDSSTLASFDNVLDAFRLALKGIKVVKKEEID
jgi:hypothetical protein